jgi:hypothetical protein
MALSMSRIAIRLDGVDFSDNGQAFAAILLKTWSKVPAAVRKEIVDHWTTLDHELCLELSDSWLPKRGDPNAEVTDIGCTMRFKAAVFQRMPEEAAMWLIAHELAHVYQYANAANEQKMKKWEKERAKGGLAKDVAYMETENQADELARGWGFNFAAFCDWEKSRFRPGDAAAKETKDSFGSM